MKPELLHYAFNKIKEKFSGEIANIPETWPISYEKLYITLYENGCVLACQSSKNQDIVLAVDDALNRCYNDKRFIKNGIQNTNNIDIVFTLVFSSEPLNESFILGNHAVSVKDEFEYAFLKESVAVTVGLDLKTMVSALIEKAEILRPTQYFKLLQHECSSYIRRKNGTCAGLIRAHSLVEPSSVTSESINFRLQLAGQYLKSIALKDGGFGYEYDPLENKFSDENNTIRQIATSWVFCRWVNYFQDKESVDPCYFNQKAIFDLYQRNKFESLAELSFFLLFCIEMNAPIEFQEELVNKLVAQQNEDGSFRTMIGQDGIGKGIMFYPGECLTAITEFLRAYKRTDFLFVLEKAFPFYKEIFERNPNTAFVVWQSWAYATAYEITGYTPFADFVFSMIDWLLTLQITENELCPDEIGGFKNPPGVASCPYTEGLCFGLQTAFIVGDKVRIQKYRNALTNALRFLFQLQYTIFDMYYLKAPNALGGVRESLVTNKIRIDYNQHFISALLMSKFLLEKKYE